MFNVIRIPTKFSRWIKRLSKNDRLELFDLLLEIGAGNYVGLQDNILWDTLSLIYWEWMNMEARNGTKPKESLISAYPDSLGGSVPSESGHRVEESRVEESRVECNVGYADFIKKTESYTSITLKTFLDLWYESTETVEEFKEWFKTRIYDIYKFEVNQYKEVLMKFYDYWIQESPQKRKNKNWKATFNNSFDLKDLTKK